MGEASKPFRPKDMNTLELNPNYRRFLSDSAVATEREGETAGRQAEAGQVYGLSGDLGAGKTAWVRGFARAMGYRGRVQSPSYGLVHQYLGGRHPLHHLDLYRLTGVPDIQSAGLEEFLDSPDGITLVEWPERWWPEFSQRTAFRPGWKRIWFCSQGENFRELIYDDLGR